MKEKKNYAKLIKVLQILSFAFMGVMIATMLILINKLDISIDNADKLAEYISGGTVTVAFIIIAFTVVKSFALVFPPAVIFAVSGLIIDNVWVAICVNAVAVALSVILPYYFGRFAGKDLLDTLKIKFPKIKKLDDFAGKNEFMVVYVVKASGVVPSDLMSVIYGAMNVNFLKFFIASNLGMLPFNILFTLLANKGDLSNPYSLLYIVPIPVFVVIMSIVVKKMTAKKVAEDTASDK
ncbi:MAG: VTT domain-containing protein [Clostridia bacterium]|nr:VTT domain-containing protein [Clostridia bacterium]